jgi:hypothetical protein
MGFYESIYNCEDGDYCVNTGSSLNNFQSNDWTCICKKHELKVGNMFIYGMIDFILQYKKDNVNIENNIRQYLETDEYFCNNLFPDEDLNDEKFITDLREFENKYYEIEIIQIENIVIKNCQESTLVKAKVKNMDWSIFDKYKKIYFSDFDDAPSFDEQTNTIILYFDNNKIKRTHNKNNNMVYNWLTRKVELYKPKPRAKN